MSTPVSLISLEMVRDDLQHAQTATNRITSIDASRRQVSAILHQRHTSAVVQNI